MEFVVDEDGLNKLTYHMRSGEEFEFMGIRCFLQGLTYRMHARNYYVVEVCVYQITAPEKTSEQILAAERYAHYKAQYEAAKNDMEYWEGRL